MQIKSQSLDKVQIYAMILLWGGLAVMAAVFFSRYFGLKIFLGKSSAILQATAILSIFFSFILFNMILILKYLEIDESQTTSDQNGNDESNLRVLESEDFIRKVILEHLSSIEKQEKLEIISEIKRSFFEQASDVIVEEITNNITKKVEPDKHRISRLFAGTESRLKSEILSLNKRGNLNLALGILISILGLLVLFYYISSVNSTTKPMEFFALMLPRFSLIILVEIFAYFFLRLYKMSITEIKYFQNELTNIEMKRIALMQLTQGEDVTILSEIVKNFISTERNYILEKGQSTVDIEKCKYDKDLFSQYSEKLIGLLENIKLKS